MKRLQMNRVWRKFGMGALFLGMVLILKSSGTGNGSFQGSARANNSQWPVEMCEDSDELILGRGERACLINPDSASAQERAMTFSSSRSDIASVNDAGEVTGKKNGTAVIAINDESGNTASVRITVKKAPSSVKVIADRTALGVGETMQLGYALSSGSAGKVTFSAPENNGVLTVTPDGVVTAIAPGSATVTATTFNGRKKSVTLNVLPGPQEIRLSAQSVRVGVGDEYLFCAEMNEGAPGSYRFSSADAEIASIDPETGGMKGIAQGQTHITVTAYNGVSASALVDVLPPPEEISLEGLEATEDGRYRLELRRGQVWSVALAPSQYSAIGLEFSSSQPDVAEADADGRIRAKRSGSAQITVRSYSGASAIIEVNVVKWTDKAPWFMIAHAMGGIDGQSYSNSLEAFEENYAEGYRYFEVDFSYTSDGELVLWHDWAINRINRSVQPGYVPSKAEFSSMRIFDRYTPLTLEDLFKLMLQYPDIWIVSDTKETSAAVVRRQFAEIVSTADKMGARSALSRWIVYLYSKGMYDVVESVYSFNRYAFALYKTYYRAPSVSQMKDIAAFCEQRDIEWIVMSRKWWKESYAPILTQYDVDVALYTVNSAPEAQKYLDQGVKGIITDDLSPNGT